MDSDVRSPPGGATPSCRARPPADMNGGRDDVPARGCHSCRPSGCPTESRRWPRWSCACARCSWEWSAVAAGERTLGARAVAAPLRLRAGRRSSLTEKPPPKRTWPHLPNSPHRRRKCQTGEPRLRAMILPRLLRRSWDDGRNASPRRPLAASRRSIRATRRDSLPTSTDPQEPRTSWLASQWRRSAIALEISRSWNCGPRTRCRRRKRHRPPSRSLVGRPDGVYAMFEWREPLEERC
jgi:hypothetical protein